jgi:hypothetical protein
MTEFGHWSLVIGHSPMPPPSRRRRDEDDDRDPPRRRRRDDDDEDEDRPARSRRRAADDERPRRNSRRADPEDQIPEGTPRVYKHKKCGGKVRMPKDVVLTYLDDPFLYNEFTDCSRCGDAVPRRECVWVETGQRLDEYFEDLQAEAILSGRHEYKLPGPPWLVLVIPPAPLIGLALAMAKDIGITKIAAVLLAVAISLPVGLVWMWIQWKKERRTAIAYKRRIIKNFKTRRSRGKTAAGDE